MYEWDEAKNATTLKDRGFGFEIMEGFMWDYALCVDVQNHDGEERELWLGPIENHLFAVVITMRGEAIRVISLRHAEQPEIRRWREEIGQ